MRTVALGTADVVSPVFSASEVVVILFCCVAGQAGIGDRFRVHSLERSDLHLIATRIDVLLARTMTCFTSDDFPFPGFDRVKLAVLGSFEHFELCFVTRRARFRTDVVVVRSDRRRRRLSVTARVLGYRSVSECDPQR